MRLCLLDEVAPGKARAFRVGKTHLVMVRLQTGDIRAFLNRCPHLGVPLNWGDDQFMDSEGKLLRCATHGALFEPDNGLCILGPCRGESLWQLECRTQAGYIEIDETELPPDDAPL